MLRSEHLLRKNSFIEFVFRTARTVFSGDFAFFYSEDGSEFGMRFNGNLDDHCVSP